jgi:hypothetical protein
MFVYFFIPLQPNFKNFMQLGKWESGVKPELFLQL